MDRIGHIPAEIVQGRYDMICPARTAFELAAAGRQRASRSCRTLATRRSSPAYGAPW